MALVGFGWCAQLSAQNPSFDLTQNHPEAGYLARINQQSPTEVLEILQRITAARDAGAVGRAPVVVVIHGPEVGIFAQQNYLQYKTIVDTAERLVQSDGVHIRVCRASADAQGIDETAFPSFVERVEFGPDEIARLLGVEEFRFF